MYVPIKELMEDSTYQVQSDGSVSIVNNPLFSFEKLHKFIRERHRSFFATFLETGYEHAIVRTNQQVNHLEGELCLLAAQLSCLKMLYNRVERDMLHNRVACQMQLADACKREIDATNRKFEDLLGELVSNNNIFYQGVFIKNNRALKERYVNDKYTQFSTLVNQFLLARGQDLATISEKIEQEKSKQTKTQQVMTKVLEQEKTKLKNLIENFENVMVSRRNEANTLLKRKDETYRAYNVFFQALIDNKAYINIPVNLVIDNNHNILLHKVLNAEFQSSEIFVELFISRGANPYRRNNAFLSALMMAANQYVDSNCTANTRQEAIFKLLLESFTSNASVTRFNFLVFDSLPVTENKTSLVEKVLKSIDINLPKMVGHNDLNTNWPVTQSMCENLLVRVEKFMSVFRGLLETLEKQDNQYLLKAIRLAFNEPWEVKGKPTFLWKQGHQLSYLLSELSTISADNQLGASQDFHPSSRALVLLPPNHLSQRQLKMDNIKLSLCLAEQKSEYQQNMFEKNAEFNRFKARAESTKKSMQLELDTLKELQEKKLTAHKEKIDMLSRNHEDLIKMSKQLIESSQVLQADKRELLEVNSNLRSEKEELLALIEMQRKQRTKAANQQAPPSPQSTESEGVNRHQYQRNSVNCSQDSERDANTHTRRRSSKA